MTTAPPFDRYLERVEAGERLSPDDIRALATTPDILPLGMLADALRRRKHGDRVTYLRVAACAFDKPFGDAVPPSAREVRITGAPESLDEAIAAVKSARAIAGDRLVSAFAWADVERLTDRSDDSAPGAAPRRSALSEGGRVSDVLDALRDAGLDAIAHLPLDAIAEPAVAIDRLTKVGFQQLRLSIDKAPAADRVALLLRAAELQDQFACIQTIDPLPSVLNAFRPTTGYEDVKMVAIARLAAPNVPTIQVDWQRYGPKLAQVALTFGADDIDNVSASDDAPEGRRRAALEEIRRNIEAAGFEPAERDGRFAASSL